MSAVPKSPAALTAEARAAIASGELRRLRILARLSQRDIGLDVGVSAFAVCKWENGERMPRGEHAIRLARLLRILRLQLDGDS